MQAKVKLKDAQGHEYLLLVTKVNQKGLLVGYLPNLEIDATVSMELQLGDKSSTIRVEGAVHKFIDQPTGGKATIIRFVNLSDTNKNALQYFMSSAQRTNSEFFTNPNTQISKAPPPSLIPSALSIPTPRNERTMVVDSDSITHLALQSPDREANFVASTMDEESIHQSDGGLAGKTIIAPAIPIKLKAPSNNGKKWLMTIGLIVLGGVFSKAIGPCRRFLDARFATPPGIPTPTADATPDDNIKIIGTPEESPSPAETPPTPTTASSENTSLDIISFDEKDTYLKVRIQGKGDFSKNSVERSSSPKKLTIDFPLVNQIKLSSSTISVGKTPVLRIRCRAADQGIRVTLDLYPVDFPKYDLKSFTDGIDITFNR